MEKLINIKIHGNTIIIDKGTQINKETYPNILDLIKIHKGLIINCNVTNTCFNIDDLKYFSNIIFIEFGKGSCFNQKIDNLPYNLERLILSDSFNQKIDNLPSKLWCMKIGNNFNQEIDNLPQSLEILDLGNNFNKNIDNLPDNMHTLQLGKNFDQEINKLPSAIKY